MSLQFVQGAPASGSRRFAVKERALEMLEWGAGPSGSPYTHLQIAEWCDQLWRAQFDEDVPVDLDVVVPVLRGVECQWDPIVASNHPELANDREGLRSARVPLAWFNQWARQVRA